MELKSILLELRIEYIFWNKATSKTNILINVSGKSSDRLTLNIFTNNKDTNGHFTDEILLIFSRNAKNDLTGWRWGKRWWHGSDKNLQYFDALL